MGSSQTHTGKRICHFFDEKTTGETPVFRSVEYPLDVPLPDKFKGKISTLLEAFE